MLADMWTRRIESLPDVKARTPSPLLLQNNHFCSKKLHNILVCPVSLLSYFKSYKNVFLLRLRSDQIWCCSGIAECLELGNLTCRTNCFCDLSDLFHVCIKGGSLISDMEGDWMNLSITLTVENFDFFYRQMSEFVAAWGFLFVARGNRWGASLPCGELLSTVVNSIQNQPGVERSLQWRSLLFECENAMQFE